MNPEGSTYKYTQHKQPNKNAQKMQMIYEKFLKFHSKESIFHFEKCARTQEYIKFIMFSLFAPKTKPTQHPDGFTQKLSLIVVKTLVVFASSR